MGIVISFPENSVSLSYLQLYHLGLNVIPLQPRSKKPEGSWNRWKYQPQTEDDVRTLFSNAPPNANVGVVCGIHNATVSNDWGFLLVIDCDSMESLYRTWNLVRESTGQETAIVQTARGGHIYLRTPWPARTRRFDGGEVRGYGGYVVGAGSIHPTGAVYTWLNNAPIVAVEELPEIPLEPLFTHQHHLPRLVLQLMLGDPKRISAIQARMKDKTRSALDRAFILSLTNKGFSYDEVKRLYQVSRHPKHLDPRQPDFDKRLKKEYERALTLGHSATFLEQRTLAERIILWAHKTNEGLGAPRVRESNRRVLIAIAEKVWEHGKAEWHMSVRDVQLQARCALRTANRALQRLEKLGLIQLVRKSKGTAASTWRWGPKALAIARATNDNTSEKPGKLHVAFEESGLGRNAARVFDACLSEASTEEIIALTGFSPRTTKRHLHRLAAHGLVTCSQGKWRAARHRLAEVAERLGSAAAEARRISQVARERATHKQRMILLSRVTHSPSRPTVCECATFDQHLGASPAASSEAASVEQSGSSSHCHE